MIFSNPFPSQRILTSCCSVCVTSILRLFTIRELGDSDQTWTNVASAIWTSVECSTAVICGCLPTYKPLFRGLLGTVRRTRRDSITSLTPLSVTTTQRLPSTFSMMRKYSGYSITSPSRAAAANEKRVENFGKIPHFAEIEYLPNRRSSRAGTRSTNGVRSMTELSPGQTSDQWNKGGDEEYGSVRLSDHVVTGSENEPRVYR